MSAGLYYMPFETESPLRCNRLKGDGFRLGCFLALGLELAVDSDVGILVETGVGLHARFRLGAAFEDGIIMPEEAHAPFEGFYGMVMFECMRLSLCFFDEFAVRYTRRRPVFREMVSV